MDVRIRRGFTAEVRRDQRLTPLLVAVATRIAGRVAAATPVHTGATRASTHVEGGHRSADGTAVAARVVQGGAGVQQQFGNAHEPTPTRQFNRGATR